MNSIFEDLCDKTDLPCKSVPGFIWEKIVWQKIEKPLIEAISIGIRGNIYNELNRR